MSAHAARAYIEDTAKLPGFYNDESVALCGFFLDIIYFRKGFFLGDILEIGVYRGLSATHFASHLRPGETIYLNDIHDDLEAVCAEVGRRSGTQGKVTPLHMFSSMIGREHVPDKSVCFMHIDGDHGRRSIRSDLDLAARVLRPEGVLVLDDFFSPEYAAVTYGCFEWMSENRNTFELVLVGFEKAYLCRPGFVSYYVPHIARFLPDYLRETGISDFTLARGTFPSDCVTIGIYRRRFDRDVIAPGWNPEDPDGPDGRELHL